MAGRRGVALVLILILIAGVVSAAGMLLLAALGGTPPTVASNTTVYLRAEAPFDEIAPSDVFSQFLRRAPSLRETTDLIARAARDARVTGLVVMPRSGGALWGQLQEFRDALVAFRATGKPVTAFLEFGGAAEYYVASAAGRIVLMPAGHLDLTGVATYELFLRGALDKLGVYPDLLQIGDYKTAANTFTSQAFTPAHREMTRWLNRDWYDELVRAIAEGRGRGEAEVRQALDAGPYLAEAALQAGLVDALGYEDEIDDAEPVQGTRRMEGGDYAQAPAAGRAGGSRIAVLYAAGTIASGRSSFDGGLVVGSDTFAEWLRKVRLDSSIKAVVVRIDSPGGSAVASEVIWRELVLTRDVKPVVVSMGDVAASGGYYIALPAHAIVAQPGTLTGSIGVVSGKFVLQGTLDKLGVGTAAVSDGRLAEIYSPFRPFSREERARIEEQMQAVYELFVARAAEGRGMSPAAVDAVAQGRVWTGRQARERGLVDELGGLDAALRLARERARLDPDEAVTLVVYPPRRSLYEVLANPFGTGLAAGLARWFDRPTARAADDLLAGLRRFRPGEPLALMPNLFVPGR